MSRVRASPPLVPRWTRGQEALFNSSYRLTAYWGGNGTGKSLALAELTRRALVGRLHWQRPGPHCVILAGHTWQQLGVTERYIWRGQPGVLGPIDPTWFSSALRFEGGAVRGQRIAVYDVVGGLGRGGQLVCGTFRAENLAGPRADVVITDEPLPEDVHDELWPRLLGRQGRMYEAFTPTLGTSSDISYLWRLVDDPERPWAGEIRTELTLDAVTPRGGLVERPWMDAREIAEFTAGLSAIQVDMRCGRARGPRLDTAYFSAWGPHLVSDQRPPDGTPIGVGIDHGSKPGAQRAVLSAVAGRGLGARIWTLDEYQSAGRSDEEQDATGILDMLTRQGVKLEDVDLWVGDRAHYGDRRGGIKSNDRLKAAIAKRMGLDTSRRGWSEKLPRPLRFMRTPRKYDRSVWEGVDILHKAMLGESPRLLVASRCKPLIEDIECWQGATTDPHKDGIDAWRYAVIPMLEGERY